jgi:hypothetical protein
MLIQLSLFQLRVVAHQIRKSFSDVNDWAQYLNNNPQLIAGLTCKDLMELGPRHGVPVLVSFGNFLQISVKICSIDTCDTVYC